jgi:hypothetical protein
VTSGLRDLRRRVRAASIRPIGPIGLLLVLYVVLGIGVVEPRITTDGLLYLAESRSAVLDGDVDVADEYRFDPALQIPGASEGRREFLPRDLDGRFFHTANEGMIVLFAPLILFGHVVAGPIAALGGPVSMDGYDLPYVLAIGFGTNAMVALALTLLAGYARRYVGLAAAAGGAAAIWVGSSLLHWSVFRPGHAHAPAVLLEALFVVLFLARGRDPRDRAAWLTMGAVWGLAVSVRPITGLYAIVPLLWLVWLVGRPAVDAVRERRMGRAVVPALVDRVRLILPAGLLFLAGGLVGRLPQIALTGDVSIAGSAYYEESGFLDGTGSGPLNGLASLLLDPSQGTLWWVPIVPLAILGLAWYWRKDRLVAVAGLLWVGAIWVFVGMLGYPQRFGGPTYASRHLVEATPIYVLGAAGLVPLIRAAVRTLARGRGLVAGTIVGAGLVVSTTAWGAIQYVATEVVPGAAGLDPITRMARILSNLPSLRRLLVSGPPGDPQPGAAFIGGRLAGGLDDRGAVSEAALALVILVGLGLAWAAIARLGLRWVLAPSGPGLPVASAGDHVARRRPAVARWAGRAAWVVAATIALALIAPAIVRPRLAGQEGDRAIATWTAGAGPPVDGRVQRIVVGSSPTGNRVVSPPFVEPGAPQPGASLPTPVAFADVPAGGLTGAVESATDWSALTGIRFAVEASTATAAPTSGGLVVELRRSNRAKPALLVEVPAATVRAGVVTVATPLALEPPASGEAVRVEIRIRPSRDGPPPRLGVTASGELALEPLGIQTPEVPDVRLAGQPLFGSPPVSLPSEASIEVAADGRAKMRVGPWNPELLLRSATEQTGWSFPGPSADPGTWTDSVIKTSRADTPLVLRVDALWPIRTATLTTMVSSLARQVPAAVVLSGSGNGSTFRRLTTFEPAQVVRQQDATATLTPNSPTTSVWFGLDLVGTPGTTGVNAVWFDLELVPPEGTLTSLTSATAGQLDVSAGTGVTTPQVTVDVAVDPTIVEWAAWAANDVTSGAISAPGPLLLLLIAAGLVAAAYGVFRLAGRVAAAGIVVLAITFLGIGVAGLPRTVLVPRTQALADGILDGAIGEGSSIVATSAGATYVSPIISIPVGSKVDRVTASGRLGTARVTVRTVATDGAAGQWLDPTGSLRTEADGLQVRVQFESKGSRLDRIRIDYRPPLGS